MSYMRQCIAITARNVGGKRKLVEV